VIAEGENQVLKRFVAEVLERPSYNQAEPDSRDAKIRQLELLNADRERELASARFALSQAKEMLLQASGPGFRPGNSTVQSSDEKFTDAFAAIADLKMKLGESEALNATFLARIRELEASKGAPAANSSNSGISPSQDPTSGESPGRRRIRTLMTFWPGSTGRTAEPRKGTKPSKGSVSNPKTPSSWSLTTRRNTGARTATK
jgi:hypothetical protein